MNTVVAVLTAVVLGVLPTTTPRTEQVADGSTTQFFYNFKTTSAAHVTVYVDDVLQASGYTVTLNADQNVSPGGKVTFGVAPADDKIIRIDRNAPASQSSVWPNHVTPKWKTLEEQLDARAMVEQQLERDKASAAGLNAEIAARIAADSAETAARIAGDASTLATAQGYANDAVSGALAGTGAVPAQWTFTGDGSDLRFPIAGASHAAAGMYLVTLSGVTQTPGTDYTIDLGTQEVVFTVAPANGVPGTVRSFGYARAVNIVDSSMASAHGVQKSIAEWVAEETNTRGRALADAVVTKIKALGLGANKPSAITRKDSTTLLAYRPLGGRFWQEAQLTTGGIASGPYSWNQTRVVELMSYILSANAAVTYTGAWNDLTSQAPNTYMGGRAKWAAYAAGTEKVEITGTFGGDVYVIFVGRTNGGYSKVEIDNDTEKANALPSTGAYRYLDTYNAVDLTYKSKAKIATGLPYGSHTIRLTLMTDRNAANTSGVSRLYFNGIGFVSRELGLPQQADTRAPPWKTGTVYGAYDQVQHLGRSYSTLAGGTAGATPPTHTTGSVSDGGVTWLYMTDSSYDLDAQYLQAAGSQLEYAYQIKPDSAGTTEDVGGVVHGNETLTSLAIVSDGDRVSDVAAGSWLSGDLVAVEQSITATHSTVGNVATETLRHEVSPRGVTVTHDHSWLVSADVGWFYAAMWPLLHWSAGTGEYRYGIDSMWTPQAGTFAAASYYGQSNPIVGKQRDFVAVAWGDVLMPKGSAGVSSGQAGPMTAVAAIYVPPESVNGYAATGSTYAGLAMNISGATAPGFSSDVVKLYFERAPLSPAARVAAGQTWRCSATYLLSLVPSSTFNPVDP